MCCALRRVHKICYEFSNAQLDGSIQICFATILPAKQTRLIRQKTPPKPLAIYLPQPNPSPTTVLFNELDAGGFQGGADGGEGAGMR